VVLFVIGVSAAIGAQGPVTGAVFTTNRTGTFVNGNVYDDAHGPYLNGGPRPNSGNCTAAGLANGDYYFQVTDPSGSELLSTDTLDSQRRFTVTGGIITAYAGGHATGTGRCGDTTIQLFPFEATSNAGGEYKVWVTPVDRYLAGSGVFGFIHRYTKTDNFKVAALTDSDGDGIPDADDNCPFFYDPSNACYTVR
jgi:hypothetical protein